MVGDFQYFQFILTMSTGLDNNPFPRREEHPLKDAPYSIPGKDETFYENLLSKNQSRLFEAGEFMFEILFLLHNNEASNRSTIGIENIANINELNTQLRVGVSLPYQDQLSNNQQENADFTVSRRTNILPYSSTLFLGRAPDQ